MKILVLNAGSSSQKSCLFELGDGLPQSPPKPLWEAQIDWSAGAGSAELQVKSSAGPVLHDVLKVDSRATAIKTMLETLWSGPTQCIRQRSGIDVVGHRVVHGGHDFEKATMVTPEVRAAIAALAVYAPLHNRADLEGMEAIDKILGPVCQVAVFDTSFHSQMPPAAATYPGPYEWIEKGIRRYGFHGISHQYCAQRAAEILGRDLTQLRLVTCHLGNGCSLAAIKGGTSVDTTMGFTPLEGLMMGTRSGSVDPGILIHLLREEKYSADQLEETLNQKSGLLGISGLSSDMRQILATMNTNERAQLAFDIFTHRLRSSIGAMLASLGGLDALVFAGGIGENSPQVRAAACDAFGFLGLKIDAHINAASPVDMDISAESSTVRVLVIRTQEDWAIARECWKLARI
ncbi:MAG TPA: acetate kinase [Terriglobia bacterium]|nr:acetate kinase [Terriglobia bacterium]